MSEQRVSMAKVSLLEDIDNPYSQSADNKETDPLVRQLPNELLEYVTHPSDNQSHIEYVDRSGLQGQCHMLLACLCCPYSLVRMVLVREGEIALTQNGDQPEILGPGRHVLLSPFNIFVGVRNVTANTIVHGPLHIIRVEIGQLGYGVDMKTGRPIFLTRGKHVINDNNFVWKKFITLRDRITQLDQLQIIRIETGYVGYAYRRGKLEVLTPGLHLIEPPDRFGSVLSTQMTIIDLPTAVHETSDYVPLSIKAAVFYRILDPEKALRRISNINQQITETAIATLAGIIRSSSLSDIASRSKVNYHNRQSSQMNLNNDDQITIPQSSSMDMPSAPPFFQHVHDEFLQQLHDHVLDEWGVEIQNIRVESLKINDPQLQKSISAQSIDVSRQHNKYIMLQKQSEIVMVEANAMATKRKIEVEAEATAIRAAAKADADAILIRAKAQKQAIELKGEGEAAYAMSLESTKLGKDMSIQKMQSDALSGLKQVAYIPHLPQILNTNGMFKQ